jgi:hypothetical protein
LGVYLTDEKAIRGLKGTQPPIRDRPPNSFVFTARQLGDLPDGEIGTRHAEISVNDFGTV